MQQSKPVTTPIETDTKLLKEDDDEAIDATLSKQIIGSFRYLSHTKPDIAYGVCLIGRFTDKSMTSHLIACQKGSAGSKNVAPFAKFPELNNSLSITFLC
ncbi:hypothetical protein QL285_043816 [Trifolium repens]|nr:hypothetical protein QL285_043816 [Trifolium repens]